MYIIYLLRNYPPFSKEQSHRYYLFTKKLPPFSKEQSHEYYLSFLNKHPKPTNSHKKINEKFDDYILKT